MRVASPESRVEKSQVLSPESRVASQARDYGFWRLGTQDSGRISCGDSRPRLSGGAKLRRGSFRAVALLLLGAGCTGCGYHTAGHAVQLPENVKTIAVPAFKNETSTYRIEQMLTASVVREFTTRTHYRILNNPSEEADATLTGTVLSTTASPLAYDTSSGRAASILVVVSMRVSLSDRNGKVLYQNPAYMFREQYEVSQDLQSFFEEDSPAFRRLSQDFARTLVANILEGF